MHVVRRLWVLEALVCLGLGAGAAISQTGGEVPIPEGTQITLELNDHLSTKLSKEGDIFTAIVTAPVYVSERLVIPKGSLVTGNVSRVIRPGRFKGKAVMNLFFQSVRIPGKGEVPIVATLSRVDTPGGDVEVLAENRVQGTSSKGRDAGRVAGPTLGGAGIGGIAGGGKGAAIGAGIGAAVGLGTVFTTRGKDLEVRRGSAMEIRLDRPVHIAADLTK
jgi:hypothetical protein